MAALMIFLKAIVVWVLAGAIARLLAGAGIALVTFSLLDDAVEALLNQLQILFSGLPAAVVNIMLMMGVGDALSIIGSALMTVAAMRAAGMVLGVRFV